MKRFKLQAMKAKERSKSKNKKSKRRISSRKVIRKSLSEEIL
jgi:hypothetical protein